MARPSGKATISLGMISIPVGIYPVASSRDVSFHTLHTTCGSQLKQLMVCPTCDATRQSEIEATTNAAGVMAPWGKWGVEVPKEEKVRGYEYSKTQNVPVPDQALAQIPLPTKNTIALDTFVQLAGVGREYVEKTYYLLPDKDAAAKPYVLLYRALQQTGLAGVAKFALRTKESLTLIRAGNGLLILELLYWPDELKLAEAAAPALVSISDREAQTGVMFVSSMEEPFDPSGYRDVYREAVLALVQSLLDGVELPTVEEAPALPPAGEDNLMAMLEASLAARKAEKAA
jgi:DNA end-binding protein Ku